MTKAVATTDANVSTLPARARAQMTPLDVAQAAIKSGNVEIVQQGFALYKEMQAMQALVAFNNALADAKAKIPTIRKNREVDFTSPKGRTNYRFEDLAEIARTVDPILAEFGLSYRYRVTSAIGEPVTVTCIISHRDGHFEETTLCAGRDESGNKNSIQGVGSTITYLQRYTLKAALGLAVSSDNDGRTADAEPEAAAYVPPPGSITQEQADELRDLLEAKGASRTAFLQWAKQKRFEDIPADYFESCKDAIAKFRKA